MTDLPKQVWKVNLLIFQSLFCIIIVAMTTIDIILNFAHTLSQNKS